MIRKDILRTMQEFDLFKDEQVQHHLQQMLYMWAKENPEWSYQ
jgi:hypothetical protein